MIPVRIQRSQTHLPALQLAANFHISYNRVNGTGQPPAAARGKSCSEFPLQWDCNSPVVSPALSQSGRSAAVRYGRLMARLAFNIPVRKD